MCAQQGWGTGWEGFKNTDSWPHLRLSESCGEPRNLLWPQMAPNTTARTLCLHRDRDPLTSPLPHMFLATSHSRVSHTWLQPPLESSHHSRIKRLFWDSFPFAPCGSSGPHEHPQTSCVCLQGFAVLPVGTTRKRSIRGLAVEVARAEECRWISPSLQPGLTPHLAEGSQANLLGSSPFFLIYKVAAYEGWQGWVVWCED